MKSEDEKRNAAERVTLAVMGGDSRLVLPVESDGVVRSADYAAYEEARGVLAGACEQAAKIAIQAEADAQVEREHGYQEGLAAGRAEMFRIIAGYQERLRANVDDRVEELMRLVSSSVEEAIGSLPPRDFLGGLVVRAVRTFADANKVEIYAHRNSVRLLEETLTHSDKVQAGLNFRVLNDTALGEDEFRLVTGEFSISYSRSQLLTLMQEALAASPLRSPSGAALENGGE